MLELELTDIGPDFSDTDVVQAIKSRNCKRLLFLIHRGFVDVNHKDPETGDTYLHLLIRTVRPGQESKSVPLLYALSNAGIDMKAKDIHGDTALRLSIKKGLPEMMVACLKTGGTAEPGDEDLISKHTSIFSAYEFYNWFKKLSPGYWEAVEDNNTFRVNKLVKSWCRINIQRGKESLLEFAKRTRADKGIITHLEQNEASIEFAHATIAGDEDRMKMLLCNQSVNLNVLDYSHRKDIFSHLTPLTLREAALLYGHQHVVHLLGPNSVVLHTGGAKSSTVCSIT